MRKDYVIWGGCALLFVVGAIWGMAWTPKDFFRVQSIHDALDIVAALATVVGVFAALYQLSSWRKQQASGNDHALAVRAAAIVNDREYQIKRIWIIVAVVHFGIAHRKIRENAPAPSSFLELSKSTVEEFRKGAPLLKDISFECEMFWGAEYVKPLADLIKISDLCAQYMDQFKSFASGGPTSILGGGDLESLERTWGELEKLGLTNNGEVIAYVNSRTRGFVDVLRREFISSTRRS